ncbi:hypothetical protein GQ457_09G024280 [Hibiscus cannabinus]
MPRSKSKDSAARSDDYGWRWGEVVEGSRNNVKCKFCGRILTGGITQLKEHLAAKKEMYTFLTIKIMSPKF